MKIVSSLVIMGISWMVYTTVETKGHLRLIEYKLDQNNIILQNLYETKQNKTKQNKEQNDI